LVGRCIPSDGEPAISPISAAQPEPKMGIPRFALDGDVGVYCILWDMKMRKYRSSKRSGSTEIDRSVMKIE
jgi:hypothetical protein